jgi:hypothetical protein
MVSRQNLFLLRLGLFTFRFQYIIFATVFAHVLLTATHSIFIFDDILILTNSTFVYNNFDYPVRTTLHDINHQSKSDRLSLRLIPNYSRVNQAVYT